MCSQRAHESETNLTTPSPRIRASREEFFSVLPSRRRPMRPHLCASTRSQGVKPAPYVCVTPKPANVWCAHLRDVYVHMLCTYVCICAHMEISFC